jgi:PKD repeat protein
VVRVKATIGGSPVRQLRTINAQNSFCGHDAFRIHVGLGDAAAVDSLGITWPSGRTTVLTGVAARQILRVTETPSPGFLRPNFSASVTGGEDSLEVHFHDISAADPAAPVTAWAWDLDGDGATDASGPAVSRTYVAERETAFTVSLTVSSSGGSKTITRGSYIVMTGPVAHTSIDAAEVNFGTLDVNTVRVDTTFLVFNAGRGGDSVTVERDSSVKGAGAIEIMPIAFTLPAGDSVLVRVSVFPSRVTRNALNLYSETIAVRSRHNRTTPELSKRFRFRLTGTLTGVDSDSRVPRTVSLSQNFPNPFNPETVIRWEIPARGEVRLSVFDLLGREVEVLVDDILEGGVHTIRFGAGTLPSGIYVYRLQAGGREISRRMTLLR